MKSRIRNVVAVLAAMSTLLIPVITYAAATPTLNQTVNAGTLTFDIFQSDGVTPVAAPTVAFPALNRSFTCQTNTATLGDSNNKLYVTNFATNSTWNIAIAATTGPTATWTSGGNTYKFNDATGSGCTNGQLTADPSVGTVTLDCNTVCTSAAITKGSSTAFVSGTANSVTLMSSSNGTAWKGYLTGVGLSQKIPASQPAGSYALPMTITLSST